MDKTESAELLTVLQAAYPSSYRDMDEKTMFAMISLWERTFKDIPVGLVFGAVEALIPKSKFPPSIAEVIEQLKCLYDDVALRLHCYRWKTLDLPPNLLARYQAIEKSLLPLYNSDEQDILTPSNIPQIQ